MYIVLTPSIKPSIYIKFHKLMGILQAHTDAIGCIGLSWYGLIDVVAKVPVKLA